MQILLLRALIFEERGRCVWLRIEAATQASTVEQSNRGDLHEMRF